MVSAVPNPALDAFISRVAPEIIFAEALVRTVSEGFDVRNVADREAASLRPVSASELREIAQFTESKEFRALKSAPTMQRGWCFLARNSSELEFALQCLYPAAVADWFAAQQPDPPVTSYREFAARQTGMYRVTTTLTDKQVAHVARAGCNKRFCLKQRLWTVEGLGTDSNVEKSLIPCLEPCALLLEFARSFARVAQGEEHSVPLTADELLTVMAGLERMNEWPRVGVREADFNAPDNPRKIQLLFDKLKRFADSRGVNEDM